MIRQVIGYYGKYKVRWICKFFEHKHWFKFTAWLCEWTGGRRGESK